MAIRAEQVQNGDILKYLSIQTNEGVKSLHLDGVTAALTDKYTKTEVDNLLAAHLVAADWKESVATENDIVTTYGDKTTAVGGEYPQPGWTVNVKNYNNTGKMATYRFNGETWERTTLLPTDITEDATHRFVTDAEKTLWNSHTTLANVEGAHTFKTETIAFAELTTENDVANAGVVLSQTPIATDPIRLIINGVVYTATAGDFTVNVANKKLVWAAASHFALASTDVIVAEYFYDSRS